MFPWLHASDERDSVVLHESYALGGELLLLGQNLYHFILLCVKLTSHREAV